MALVAQNIDRLNHLLALFKLTKDELLTEINKKSTDKINEEDVFSSFIKVSVLNKIDKIFNKGLHYYANPSPPTSSADESIFFRKDSFNSELNLRSKQIVNKFEEEKLNFDTLSKLTDSDTERILPVFTIHDNPVHCAGIVRNYIYPTQSANTKDFLRNLISTLAAENVLVFEFFEGFSRKDPANINGFYLTPNVIVLKWQKYTKREIFTLAHEIGHYLLLEEDIDERVNFEALSENLSEVEKWCNNFAFSFLAGEYLGVLNSLSHANTSNDYHNDIFDKISQETHISKLALYTHFFYAGKLTKSNYEIISENTNKAIKDAEIEAKRVAELKKQIEGDKSGGRSVRELFSPLYVQTLQSALYNGIVDEYEFCRKLKIDINNIESYLA